MADAMEIIISAVDSASEVFQSIIESASNMASGITDAVGTAGGDFDTIAENAANFSDSVSNIDTSTLEELAAELGMDTEEVERLISSAADIGSMSAGFNEVAAAADDLEQEIQDDIDKMDELGSAGDVMAAQTFMDFAKGASDTMSEMADKAGSVQDSWTRLGLAADGAGISMDNMKSAVSGLSDETGRAGGSIRESFIAMTSAGITDMNTMQTVFKGASAQAFILGTDVNSLADKFSGMAMKSTLSEKTLKGTGITMAELGEAMGLHGATVDEVKDKWSELDTNQRAAALGMAASMNEGKDANEEYKNSWQGLQDQVEIAKGKLETMAGKVLLPVLVPAMKLASDILSGFGSVIDSVMNGPFGGLVSIVGASAGVFMIAFAGVLALKNILGFLKLEASLAKIEMLALTFAEEFQATGSITSAAANMIGATGFSGLATAAWGAATAVWAAIAPLLPFIAAAALVAIAIYEVGKAFGWWHDVGSMIEAISAGLQEMWNAFVNHPDVQALIQAISSGWEWLSGAIGRAWQAVLDFFGVSSSSNFDIVATLIHGIGAAWDMIREPVMAFCDQVMLVLSVIASVIDGNMSMSDAVIAIWDGLVKNIPIILSGLGQLLGTIWAGIGSLMLSVVRGAISGIVGWFASLPGRILAYLTATRNYIFTQMLNWVQVTRQRAMEIITGILTFFRTLPGRVLAILAMVGRHILTQGMQWIVNAKTRATGVVNGVINFLSNLPGKVYSALHAAAKSILDAGKEWVDAAKQKAQAVVDGAYNTLSGLPGKISSALGGVASAITKPFQDAYDTAKGIWDSIAQLASSVPGVRTASGGFDLDANGNPIIETGTGRHDVLDVNISLKDVPDGVDETFLVEVITSRSVIDALVNNQYYQSANSTANLRYQGKVLRSG